MILYLGYIALGVWHHQTDSLDRHSMDLGLSTVWSNPELALSPAVLMSPATHWMRSQAGSHSHRVREYYICKELRGFSKLDSYCSHCGAGCSCIQSGFRSSSTHHKDKTFCYRNKPVRTNTHQTPASVQNGVMKCKIKAIVSWPFVYFLTLTPKISPVLFFVCVVK